MRKIISLIIILAISTNLFSQIDTPKVAFISYWSIGDSYDYKITKIKQQWRAGKLTKEQKLVYLANFTVIDSTANSYTIKWSYENDLENTYQIPKELMDKFSKYKITEIKYKTSEVGNYLEILNWKEVGENRSRMLDDIIDIVGDNDEKKKHFLKTALQPFKQIYSSKQGIEQLVLKELQYFHFPMGAEFDIHTPLIYDDELPNMFGGKPIKAKVKIYIEKVNYEENYCILKHEMSLDPDDTKKMIKQVFKDINLDDKEMEIALKTFVYKIQDRNTYEFYFNPGIPRKIETKRETIIDSYKEKTRRVDKIIIELLNNK